MNIIVRSDKHIAFPDSDRLELGVVSHRDVLLTSVRDHDGHSEYFKIYGNEDEIGAYNRLWVDTE